MYSFIYQICTIPKNDKFEVRKIILKQFRYNSHEDYVLNYNQINNLLDNITEKEYIKVDTVSLNNIDELIDIDFSNLSNISNNNILNNNKEILFYS